MGNVGTDGNGKRKGAPSAKGTQAKAPDMGKELTPAQQADKLGTLLDKAQHGDERAWRELQAELKQIPNWERDYPGPAEYAREALLRTVLGKNLFVREAWERRVSTMTRELAGADASPLERLLCERVATCWLEAELATITYAGRVKEGGLPFTAGEYYQKLQDRAHKRYLAACTALAKVRRLLAPVAQQINIAQPGAAQLNIAQPTAQQIPQPAARQVPEPAELAEPAGPAGPVTVEAGEAVNPEG